MAKLKIRKVASLADLRRKAHTTPAYAFLAITAAENLGFSGESLDKALDWLDINAVETQAEEGGGEEGVVNEINWCIKFVEEKT